MISGALVKTCTNVKVVGESIEASGGRLYRSNLDMLRGNGKTMRRLAGQK
ncbi:hypothetical protein GP2143_07754 [marine gamma proteobacterium HTCC2143]|uniref:Uncharacterized protein n=1 Tax=marine gamma proteobacterium HTCC2143 TaxID=247633 RepID=A0YCA8_9GAMM|nr:hypothetical protein GP2143_07754 [marine gamma proteobacterium HTCC2143]